MAKPEKGTPGRTRSNESRLAILNAAMKLLETQSLQQISIEGIAREAGVGKATIYRWWLSKASLVIEAFMIHHVSRFVIPNGMGPRDAVFHLLRLLITEYSGNKGYILAQIIAEGQSDPEVLKEFRSRFWDDRRALALKLVEKACEQGELRDDIPPDLMLDHMFAPIYFHLLSGQTPLNEAFSDTLCDSLMRLLAPADHQKSTTKKSR